VSKKADIPKKLPAEHCAECWKPESLCLCTEDAPLKTRTQFLILQYPQEVKNPLGTARLVSLALDNCVHRIGLSWRSLGQALGRPPEPGTWAVLYLGSRKDSRRGHSAGPMVEALSAKGTSVDVARLRGIILLDGNWKQSKSLYWRNPWLKKLPRLVLYPTARSLYGDLRREPRKNSVSTLEAAAYVIEALEAESPVPAKLRETMVGMVTAMRNRPQFPVDGPAAPTIQ
jgi:DTW domain-containing protein YfiP